MKHLSFILCIYHVSGIKTEKLNFLSCSCSIILWVDKTDTTVFDFSFRDVSTPQGCGNNGNWCLATGKSEKSEGSFHFSLFVVKTTVRATFSQKLTPYVSHNILNFAFIVSLNSYNIEVSSILPFYRQRNQSLEH